MPSEHYPGQPSDRYFAELDRLNHEHRLELVRICETFLGDTLTAGVETGVIDADQAAALYTIAAGPR